MNKRGFTLIELIATIVILALIFAIAVPSINNVVKTIRESQRRNMISNIEVAAAKYAFDTGETIIFANDLVEAGYLDSDEEDGTINDPVTNKRLNCYLIEMEKKGNYYEAKFIDGMDYDVNGTCDKNKLNQQTASINIDLIGAYAPSNADGWVRGSGISLNPSSNDVDINCENSNNKCIWTSSSGASIENKANIVLDNINGILTTKYTFQLTFYNSDNVKRYSASVDLKIDNENPVIYPNEFTIANRFINTPNKNVTIVASDGKGSGIATYYLGIKTTGQTCNNIPDASYKSNNVWTVNKNGTYLVCVKDKVGNIGSYDSLVINHIG